MSKAQLAVRPSIHPTLPTHLQHVSPGAGSSYMGRRPRLPARAPQQGRSFFLGRRVMSTDRIMCVRLGVAEPAALALARIERAGPRGLSRSNFG